MGIPLRALIVEDSEFNVVLVKASYEVAAPAAGVIENILVRADETFAAGEPLATIRTG